jgi:hypothetical protein
MARPFFFFEGIDPAPSDQQRSDWGALVEGVAIPRIYEPSAGAAPKRKRDWEFSSNPSDWYFGYVCARVLTVREKASCRQWSGIIHERHRRFGFEKMLMDPGGGGILVQRELRAPKQLLEGVETEVTPIADQVDGPKLVARAHFILHMFKRGDPGVEQVWPDPSGSGKSLAGDELLKDAMMSSFKEALDSTAVAFPGPVAEWMAEKRTEVERWGEERSWALKNLDAATVQLKNILVATREDGSHLFTKRGAHIFQSLTRDDIAMAAMLCYGAFLIWLRTDEWRWKGNRADRGGFMGW